MKKNLFIILTLVSIVLIIANRFFRLLALHPFAQENESDFRVLAYNIHSLAEDFGQKAPAIMDVIVEKDGDSCS